VRKAVLFDLGGTLVEYYTRAEFPGILEEAIGEVEGYLRHLDLLHVPPEAVWQRVRDEDHEAGDHRVRPLERRLIRIFQLSNTNCAGAQPVSAVLVAEMCRRFLGPIFGRGRRYDDALPALQKLTAAGLQTAIVSNTPWGSPAELWREEVERHSLFVQAVVTCRDAGWRKPAHQIFEFALERLGASPQESLFVGDDPRWDMPGPRGMGMEAILIDREGAVQEGREDTIRSLEELWDRLRSRS
jgi:putative hydrolase of the HAD superfamily